MTTLLLTAIGGDVAQAVARIVRAERPSWKIIGVDIHTQHGGALFADVVEKIIPATSPSYQQCLADVAGRHRVDWCLPGSEAELAFFSGQGVTAIGDAHLVGISAKAVEIGLDKYSTASFLRSVGIPAPWTIVAEPGVLPHAIPCIFKPRRSAGSKDVVICTSESEAMWQVARVSNGVFQELLLPAEREVTCAVYRSRDGRTAVLPMLRRLSGGFTSWFKVCDAPEAVEQCERLAEAMNLYGPMNVQMRLTDKGPRIFEINPRFSSTVYMRHLLGFRDVVWLFDELDGKTVSFPVIPNGATVVRVQDAAILPNGILQ